MNDHIADAAGNVKRRYLSMMPRFKHLISKLHALGPRPVAEFVAAIGADNPELVPTLERFADIDIGSLRALGADQWPVQVFLVSDVRSGSATRDSIMRAALPDDGGDAA